MSKDEKKNGESSAVEFEDRQKIITSYRKSLLKNVTAPLSHNPLDVGNPWDYINKEAGESEEGEAVSINTNDIYEYRIKAIEKDLKLVKWQSKISFALCIILSLVICMILYILTTIV